MVLRPQMSATVKIRTDHKQAALTVPIQSVTLRRPSEFADASAGPIAPAGMGREGQVPKGEDAKIGPETEKHGKGQREEPVEVVFVIQDGRCVARQVETGLSSETRIEILDGLEDGAEVVSGPYRALSKDLKHNDEISLGEPAGKKDRRGKRGKGKH